MTEAMKLETTDEALRNALAWYGEQARLARLIHSEGDPGRWALAEDGGKRAREVLALSASPAGVVKPLEWTLVFGPDEDGDECHVASIPFGTIYVVRRGGKWQWRYCFDEYYDEDQTECEGLEDGKVKAQALWDSRISPLIDARIMSAIEQDGVKTDQQKDIEDIHKLAGMVGATFKPHEPAGVGVAPADVYNVMKRYKDNGRFDWDFVSQMCRDIAALKGDEQ